MYVCMCVCMYISSSNNGSAKSYILLEFVLHSPNISLKLVISKEIMKHFSIPVLIFSLFFSMFNYEDMTLSR